MLQLFHQQVSNGVFGMYELNRRRKEVKMQTIISTWFYQVYYTLYFSK